MKKILLFSMVALVATMTLAYRTVFFYQNFSSFPIGSFNLKVLSNDDDGSHGSNDSHGKSLLDNFQSRFFYLEYAKPLQIAAWQWGQCLKVDSRKVGTTVFSAKEPPIIEDRDFELEFKYYIDWERDVQPHWVLFRNYDPQSPAKDFERMIVEYIDGVLSLSVAPYNSSDFAVVYSRKIYLSNSWHTFGARKTGTSFELVHDSGVLYTYKYSRVPRWPVVRVELYKGSFSFATLCFFNGR